MKKAEMEREIRRLREEVDQLKAADAVSKTTWNLIYPLPSGTYWADPSWKQGPIWYVDSNYTITTSAARLTALPTADITATTPPWTARIVASNRFAEDDGLSAIGVPA